MLDKNLQTVERNAVTVLRVVVGVIFIWLGFLELAGLTPAFPSSGGLKRYFALGGVSVLGITEVITGFLLLLNRLYYIAEGLLIFYLCFIWAGSAFHLELIISSQFPQLTVQGELLLKDVAIGIAGVLVILYERTKLKMKTGKRAK
jgi:uncharacterized membrane protein YkgB